MTSLKTSIKTITYLSDIGCLEIHGASLYIDSHHLKIANSIRTLFLAIDIVYDNEKSVIGQQITAAKDDLRGKGKLDAKDLRVIHPSEKNYIVKEGEINTQRFEFYMYSRVSNHLENGVLYAAESEQNKRLEDLFCYFLNEDIMLIVKI